jgi:oligosaccharide translocation protein RFT1
MSSKTQSKTKGESKDLLSSSAGGASLLIGLQVGSRALTFIVNQLLLRYLSPEKLGISVQLEVYSITVLFFARESLRVAIQRQADIPDENVGTGEGEEKGDVVPNDHVDGRTSAGRTQCIVNLAWITIYVGPLFVVIFAALYQSSLPPAILATPYFATSLKIYGFAALWELLSEPAFVVVQQKGRFAIRGKAESIATLGRCLVTCGAVIWASRTGRELGVLPFALGQAIYAAGLGAVYGWCVWGIADEGNFSLFLKQIYTK